MTRYEQDPFPQCDYWYYKQKIEEGAKAEAEVKAKKAKAEAETKAKQKAHRERIKYMVTLAKAKAWKKLQVNMQKEYDLIEEYKTDNKEG